MIERVLSFTRAPVAVSQAAPADDPSGAQMLRQCTATLRTHMPGTLAGGLVIMAIVAWLLRGHADQGGLLLWLGLTAAINLEGWWLWSRHPGPAGADAEHRHWLGRFSLGSSLAGAIWGLTAWLLLPQAGWADYVIAVVCAMAAFGSLMHNAVHLPVVRASSAATLLPSAAYFFWSADGADGHLAVGVLLLAALVFVWLFARRHSDMVLQVMRLGIENARLRDQAEAASQAKTRFLASASHDLRQPLNVIALLSGVLQQRTRALPAHDPVRETTLQLDEAVRVMDEQIGGVLDISRLDAGAVRPQWADVDLVPLLMAVRGQFEPLAQARGLALRLRLAQPVAVVRSDRVLLQRILSNLVGNALRYTERAGVVLALRAREDAWWIDVHDLGIGMSEQEQAGVFAQFVRGHHPAVQAQPGLGLGLSVVEQMSRLLGLAVQVRSRPGRGTRFRVVLPLQSGNA